MNLEEQMREPKPDTELSPEEKKEPRINEIGLPLAEESKSPRASSASSSIER